MSNFMVTRISDFLFFRNLKKNVLYLKIIFVILLRFKIRKLYYARNPQI